MSFISLFLTTGAASGTTGTTAGAGGLLGSFGMFIPLLLILVIMYFFMIRPQNKKQKETQKMIAALKKGDKVVTIGGIHGTVYSTKENTIIVKVDDGAKIEFNRTAIASVEVDKPASAEEPKAEEKKGLFGKKSKEDKITAEIKDNDSQVAENSEAK
ncbi:MAG: preprotein translocase subunit YajC [Treponema sp.]|nr:preprotein translocase subunit YajC [Treponema sp.]MBQ2551697.1 preprotein translocase subunit YajC [Treponema sp.]MBQ4235520.1 preprotein translocase subunit YajC [Treponema sp.]MBQ5383574.1 preprotein translocase subunit YajC [Treponema sp.]